MRNFLSVIALLLLCSAAYAQGQALVTFKAPEGMEITSESVMNGQARQYIDQIAESLDARVTMTYGALSASLGTKILALVVSDSKTTEELIRDLKNHPDVLSATPNGKTRIMR